MKEVKLNQIWDGDKLNNLSQFIISESQKQSEERKLKNELLSIQFQMEEAAEIDLTNLCYYDKRNPDCSADDETIEDHKKSLLKKDKTCSCDNCFYGRTKLTEQLIKQAKRMYSEEDMRLAIHRLYQEISKEYKVPIERIMLAITDDGKLFQAYSTNEIEVELFYLCDVPVPNGA